MKPVIITVAILAAFFISTTSVQATNNDCDWKWLNGHLQYVCKTPRPTPTLSPSPTGSPNVTSIPTAVPTTTPEATSSANPSPISSGTPESTGSPSSTPGATAGTRTDLSDGRSDGKGCSVKDCSGNKVAGQSGQILPATGDNTFVWTIVIAVLVLIIGLALKFIHKIAKEDFESLSRMHGSDDE